MYLKLNWTMQERVSIFHPCKIIYFLSNMSFSLQKGSKDRELQLSNSGMRVQRTLVVSGEYA